MCLFFSRVYTYVISIFAMMAHIQDIDFPTEKSCSFFSDEELSHCEQRSEACTFTNQLSSAPAENHITNAGVFLFEEHPNEFPFSFCHVKCPFFQTSSIFCPFPHELLVRPWQCGNPWQCDFSLQSQISMPGTHTATTSR